MKLFNFHLMPWPHIPADVRERYTSSWVLMPNSVYDPVEGTQIYAEYLDQLVFADEIGFDALCVNEHHQNGYGTMPSPNVIAGVLAGRTKNAKIAILGNGIALRENPLRVAEEIAMLDVITGGRIISGFVRGIGAEYFSLNIDPSTSRARFHEAHDLIVKAWTEPGPFAWDGEHYSYKYVNVWPRPLQQPHPPIFVPSQGSSETIEWAAEHRYPYICTYTPMPQLIRYYDEYRRLAEEKFGYTAGPEQFGWTSLIHVAETEQEALDAVAPHAQYFAERCFALPPQMLMPPGYTTSGSFRRMLEARGIGGPQAAPDLNAGEVLIGTPEQVGERLINNMERCGAGIFMGMFQVGDMPHAKVMRSMELFAEKVLPHLPRDPAPEPVSSSVA